MKGMIRKFFAPSFICFFFFLISLESSSQDARAQYPGLLRKAYFGVNVGSIDYPFSNDDLKSGYQAQSVLVPHTALRLTLLGYNFNRYFSARITYMRPIEWVEFKNLNGDGSMHSVWMNVGGLTAKINLPIADKFSLYGEAGLGVITRNGFEVNHVPVVADASYATLALGGGLQYSINNKWDLNLSATYSPGRSGIHQPHTVFYSGGFVYNMHPLPKERVERNSNSGAVFPKNLLQIAYATNGLGYGVNHFFAEGVVPVFWGGQAELRKGFAINYQHNVFHTRKVFSLDIGTSFGYWESRIRDDRFFTLSVYPVLRFTAIRSRPLDLYFNYSVAGPSFISKINIDNQEMANILLSGIIWAWGFMLERKEI